MEEVNYDSPLEKRKLLGAKDSSDQNVIEEGLYYLVVLLQKYGWTILFLLIGYYFGK
jgi:hypothetical protein